MQLVAEAERELRKSVAVGRELWGRGSGAATGAVAEVEEARSKAVAAAAAALGAASSAVCGSLSSAAVQVRARKSSACFVANHKHMKSLSVGMHGPAHCYARLGALASHPCPLS